MDSMLSNSSGGNRPHPKICGGYLHWVRTHQSVFLRWRGLGGSTTCCAYERYQYGASRLPEPESLPPRYFFIRPPRPLATFHSHFFRLPSSLLNLALSSIPRCFPSLLFFLIVSVNAFRIPSTYALVRNLFSASASPSAAPRTPPLCLASLPSPTLTFLAALIVSSIVNRLALFGARGWLSALPSTLSTVQAMVSRTRPSFSSKRDPPFLLRGCAAQESQVSWDNCRASLAFSFFFLCRGFLPLDSTFRGRARGQLSAADALRLEGDVARRSRSIPLDLRRTYVARSPSARRAFLVALLLPLPLSLYPRPVLSPTYSTLDGNRLFLVGGPMQRVSW
ncbi:hypothetical protein C8R45DRAFT_1103245 [Mycena sanguinolenta]|nr:hypothetical protein C8R45DRAFT_1103245 [Mycena sanguinolenta]